MSELAGPDAPCRVSFGGRSCSSCKARVTAVVLFVWGVVETVTIGWHGWPQLMLLAAFVAAPALAPGMFSVRRLRRASAP